MCLFLLIVRLAELLSGVPPEGVLIWTVDYCACTFVTYYILGSSYGFAAEGL
jgi:hypothetical protein